MQAYISESAEGAKLARAAEVYLYDGGVIPLDLEGARFNKNRSLGGYNGDIVVNVAAGDITKTDNKLFVIGHEGYHMTSEGYGYSDTTGEDLADSFGNSAASVWDVYSTLGGYGTDMNGSTVSRSDWLNQTRSNSYSAPRTTSTLREGNSWIVQQDSNDIDPAWLKVGDSAVWIPDAIPNTFFGYDWPSNIKRTFATSTKTSFTIYGQKGPQDINIESINENGVVQFPTEGRGIARFGLRDSYIYNGVLAEHGDNWAAPDYAASLFNATQAYLDSKEEYANDLPLRYNDISSIDPENINLGHQTHNAGSDTDFLFMGRDGQSVANINQRDAARQNDYSRFLRQYGATRQYSYRGLVEGTTHAPGHFGHEHSGWRPK